MTAAQAAGVISTFDSDIEGWTTQANGGHVPAQVSPGGNPGGFLRAQDIVEGWGYLVAPAAFTLAALPASVLSFDLASISHSPTGAVNPAEFPVRVALIGSNGTVLMAAAGLPTPDWTHYAFTLDASTDWKTFGSDQVAYDANAASATQAQIDAVLGSLSALYIAADYTSANPQASIGGTELIDLDNVRLDAAVPEPAAALLAGSALLLLMLATRRRAS